MASKKQRKNYPGSKGQRPNVSKKIRNGMRADATPHTKSLLQRAERRAMIITKPQGDLEHKLKARYLEEDKQAPDIARALNKFGQIGLTKAEAVQAAKTNYMEALTKKWNIRLKAYLTEQRKKKVRV
jgi:hypothetical protein